MTDTIVLSGADVVLPDRVLSSGSIVISGGRVSEIVPREVAPSPAARVIRLGGHLVVPGFIDIHVHGLDGIDTLDGPEAVAELARRMPRCGVTAFSPTTVACPPADVTMVLAAVRDARVAPRPQSARVLPAHLESNFINPDYRGAQPVQCLRAPAGPASSGGGEPGTGAFGADDILSAIDAFAPDVGIVTMAPELEGGLDLIRRFTSAGIIVSLGHSGADYEVAGEAIRAGARQATHLFNRMPPLLHREPGLAGAVLASPNVAAEIVCDGYHVHPGMVRMTVAAKGVDRVMAITDASAGAGLPPGSAASLGGRRVTVTEHAAFLEDGTLAGSVATMDRVFRLLTSRVGLSLVEASHLCATTPARELGLAGHGLIGIGAVADLVVLDDALRVVETFISGEPVLGRL